MTKVMMPNEAWEFIRDQLPPDLNHHEVPEHVKPVSGRDVKWKQWGAVDSTLQYLIESGMFTLFITREYLALYRSDNISVMSFKDALFLIEDASTGRRWVTWKDKDVFRKWHARRYKAYQKVVDIRQRIIKLLSQEVFQYPHEIARAVRAIVGSECWSCNRTLQDEEVLCIDCTLHYHGTTK